MSHISTIQVIITDLEALKQACTSLGFTFVENCHLFHWYGSKGHSSGTNTCDHVIRIPQARYEVGVVKHNDHYQLKADFWDTRLKDQIGENGSRLTQQYAVERVKYEARKKRYRIHQQPIQGGIRLTLSQ